MSNPEADAEHAKLVEVADKLRECREELGITTEQLRIAAEAFQSARADLATARARIAELEAENTKAALAVIDALKVVDPFKTRIDQAVKALERALNCGRLAAVNTDAVEDALAALKGET